MKMPGDKKLTVLIVNFKQSNLETLAISAYLEFYSGGIFMRKLRLFANILFFMAGIFYFTAASATERKIEKFCVVSAPMVLGLEGYDPVSPFAEGGGTLVQGRVDLDLNYLGIRYRFSSFENLQFFLTNPRKYEPALGGCNPYSLARGAVTQTKPQFNLILNDKICHTLYICFQKGIFKVYIFKTVVKTVCIVQNIVVQYPFHQRLCDPKISF